MVEVSRNVVAALLVLVIVVSGFSMYYALWGPKETLPAAESGSNGEIKLTIIQPGMPVKEVSPPAQGQVVLEIAHPA